MSFNNTWHHHDIHKSILTATEIPEDEGDSGSIECQGIWNSLHIMMRRMEHKSLHTVCLMYNNYCYAGGSLTPDINKIVEEIIGGRKQHEELIEGLEEPPQREGG